MKTLFKSRVPSFLLILLLAWSSQSTADVIPLEAWIHDPVIDSVNVSPDGKKLVGLTLTNVNKAAEITVWDMQDLSAAPARFGPKDIKPLFVDWLNNDKLVVYGRQKYDFRRSGRNTKWFRDKLYIVDRKGKKFREIMETKELTGVSIESRLGFDKNKILVNARNREFVSDLYEVDLTDFRSKRVYLGSPKFDFVTNPRGDVVAKTQLENAGSDNVQFNFLYKHPETNKWEEHHSTRAKDREGMEPVAFDLDGRTVYVSDNTGLDKSVIRKYDLITRELSQPVFGGEDFEATGVIQSDHVSSYGKVIGYVGYGAKAVIEYTDPKWAALQNLIDSALPADQLHRLSSISDDLNVIVVRSTGVKEPGNYHLLLNQKELVPLGRSYPQIDPSQLSEMRYVEYEARDGLVIPAYITTPKNSKPPYPTVIMPHGGPWARDFYGWDSWAQFLANRGYQVMQPQYRGSTGWGQKLWRAGDNEWGQKMQDDKDDGAAWLVKEGLAAKDRIAIYGYSYGGYAAMAAAVRPNSPYQCAISGAGLSELRTFDKITFTNPFNREFQNPTIGGLSPLDHVKDAAIPIYIFHGDRDQRVPVNQSRKYYKALKKAGKSVEYNEIPDLWHSLPWWPTHRINLFENLQRYLAQKCGLGGL